MYMYHGQMTFHLARYLILEAKNFCCISLDAKIKDAFVES